MSARLVAERYVRALDATVEDDAQLEEVLIALEDFAELYAGHEGFARVLDNHAIPMSTREAAFREVLDLSQGLGLSNRFLLTLFRRGRISALPEVITVLRATVNNRLNRAHAEVTVAVTLDASQLNNIQSGLEKYSGKTVQMNTRVDADILGGVVVRMDGTVIDSSVRSRLERIRTALLTEEKD